MKKKRKPQPLTKKNRDYVEQVHDRTRKELDNYCRYLTANSEDAKDLRQESYVRFSTRTESKGQLENERIEKPFLFRTARNTRLNQIRDNRLPLTSLHNDGGNQAPADGAGVDDKKKMQRNYNEYAAAVRCTTYFEQFKHILPAIQSRLTRHEWELIWLRWAEQQSMDEIAASTGQSRDEVAYRIDKAKKKVKYWAGVLFGLQKQ